MSSFKLYLSLLLSAFGSSILYAGSRPVKVETGISVELALQRKAELKEIHYSLEFNIPSNKKENVIGKEVISFNRQGISDLLIDFKAESSQIKNVLANGKKVAYKFEKEHIIISSSNLKKGKNQIQISFIAGNQSLNRSDDYLYTLLVPERARTVFPCFDQPDLKARFTLKLEVPALWSAVSNTYAVNEKTIKERKTILYNETELLPTYLFSFVAGKFKKHSCTHDGRSINAFYRETDPKKIAQLDTILSQVFSSIRWMEKYTGVPYPFSKYDIIILPGFQYGGMEHAGATLYNDKRMFLSEHPTPDEELGRTELIAHETAHMWFGDLVTMKWFNDVWTKEVFANYLAAKIVEQQFPDVNHKLNFLKSYQIYALAEDRTDGTHAIQQQLDNLQNAGLMYGNIIYDKAPVMMRKMEQQMGTEAFQRGIQKYLKKYAFDNPTWDDLIDILDRENPQANLKQFSEVWVKQKGLPEISATVSNNSLIITQYDPFKRNLYWKQQFSVGLVYGNSIKTVDVNLQSHSVSIPLNTLPDYIIPNYDGMGYGKFVVDSASTSYQLQNWMNMTDDVTRQAVLMNVYENFLSHCVSADSCYSSLLQGLKKEKNALIASSICGYLSSVCMEMKGESRSLAEKQMLEIGQNHAITSCRQQLLRSVINLATDSTVVEALYNLWNEKSNKLLNENDYMTFAYQLAINRPQQYKEILALQRSRITDPDRLREFDYISRGCIPDKEEQENLFRSLLQKENRRVEPWALKLLALLNHPMREPFSNAYITPGLEVLQEIQRTGDIFFPKNWAVALLSGHRSRDARNQVNAFFTNHPDYPLFLKNKILQAAFVLFNSGNND